MGPIIITYSHPSEQVAWTHPRFLGLHAPAWLAYGGVACGVCGVRL